MTERPPRARPRPRPRRKRRGRVVALLVAGALLFAVGVALGEALHDNPQPGGGAQTNVRTLVPATLPPEQQTITVTVTTSGTG